MELKKDQFFSLLSSSKITLSTLDVEETSNLIGFLLNLESSESDFENFKSFIDDFRDYHFNNRVDINLIYENLLVLLPFSQKIIKKILESKIIEHPDRAFIDVIKITHGVYDFLNIWKKEFSFETTKSFNEIYSRVERIKNEIESKNIFDKQLNLIAVMKSLINDFERESEMSKKLIQQLYQEINEKNSKNLYLKNQDIFLEEYKKEVMFLKEENKNLFSKLNEYQLLLKDESSSKEEIVKEFKSELILSSNTIQEFKNIKLKQEIELKNLQTELIKTKEFLNDSKKEIKDLNSEKSKLQKMFDDLESKLLKKEQSIEQLIFDKKTLQESYSSLTTEDKLKTKQIKDLSFLNEKNEKLLERLNKKIEKLETKLNKVETKTNKLEKQT